LENTDGYTPYELKQFVIKIAESEFDSSQFPYYNKRYTSQDDLYLSGQLDEFKLIKKTNEIVENPIADVINEIHFANEEIFKADERVEDNRFKQPDIFIPENNESRSDTDEVLEINHQENVELIEKVLSEYSISYEEIDYVEGLAYTRYKVRLAKGERIQKVTKSNDEIKMRLRSSNVRIVAPIDREDAIGIELPNAHRKSLLFNEICKPYPILEIPVGRDINNNSVFINFSKDPHYLIGGSTGSGKSVNLNVFISYILLMRKPEEVELLLIDPKRVEFSIYSDLPHSITSRPINELEEIKSAFDYLVVTMEERYKVFENKELRNIAEYNQRYSPKLPYIFVIVDEFATISDDEEVMNQIQRLSQLARAAGIHILLATQRPSTDIVKGTIKNNFTGRIAFKVSSNHDSKTTIYESGAEDLIGKGDMLIANSGETVTRAQGAYIGLDEIKSIIKVAQQKYGLNRHIKRSFKELL
jgi:DNA segregation ATPase FtsK/SpoIIIE, S-DNA-T family